MHRTIPQGLSALYRRFDIEPLPPGGAPVFLLASAWRSGSTLLQRLLVSGGELLMWGEPYDHSALVRRLAESVVPFDDKWPPEKYFVDPADPPAADRWIANAYPGANDLMAAHRAFFDRLFDEPAQDLGFARWGIKGVRLSGEHALYLKRIYPDARFVFLYRNPYDAFLSYRLLHEIRTHSYWWWHRWPDDQVATAARFGEIWRDLTASFLEWGPQVGATIVAYEGRGSRTGPRSGREDYGSHNRPGRAREPRRRDGRPERRMGRGADRSRRRRAQFPPRDGGRAGSPIRVRRPTTDES